MNQAIDQQPNTNQWPGFVVVEGPIGVGKTTLALNIAEYVAFNSTQPEPVAVFSMEMSSEQLANSKQAMPTLR